MTISTTDSRISYNGNGVTTVFSFPYRFLVNGDLVVVEVSALGVETVKTLTTHYTIVGAGADAGGSVTMLVAPATGVRLVIYRDTDIVQETDYISGDSFPAESHERALDRLTMIMQEKTPGPASGATRAIVIPVGDPSTVTTTLPPSIARLGKFLMFNTTTGSVEVSTVSNLQVESAVTEIAAADATVTALTAGTTVNLNALSSNNYSLTPTSNFTLANPTNLINGQVINIVFTQGATPYTITWGLMYQFPGGVEPALTATASAVDFMSAYYNGATSKLICVMNRDFKA